MKIAVFVSGKGTSIKCICDAINYDILNIQDLLVISNNNSFSIKDENIKYKLCEWKKETNTREEYEDSLIDILNKYDPYLIVLAGWNHIFGKKLISNFKNIINMHPSIT